MALEKKEGFDFWNDHSIEFLEMAMKRDYQERVEACDGYGRQERSCGDVIEIFLMIKDAAVETVSYDIRGCLFSHACTNALIRLVKGRSVDQAKQIRPEQIISFLKTLPKEEEHCAVHALKAFHSALDDYYLKQGVSRF